jgi:hypothetical protein
MQYAGINYLMPIDAELHDEADLRRMARADEILADLQQAKNLRILILDSCRDNPLADELKRSLGSGRSVGLGRGLARMESPEGTIISYSTQAGRTAEDGSGRNSPYTTAFLKHIEDKDDISNVFHHISANVYESSNRTQLPELSLSFFGEFYLNGKLQITVAPAPNNGPAPAQPTQGTAENLFWDSIKASSNPADFKAYLARFPKGIFVDLAQNRLAALQQQMATKPTAVTSPAPPDNAGKTSQLAPAARPAGVAAKMHDRLIERLAALSVDGEHIAQVYTTIARPHKALAVSLDSHLPARSGGWSSGAAAVNGALEACQTAYGKPCVLVAVDDNLAAPARDAKLSARDMPRVGYAGMFDPRQIPNGRPELLLRPDVAGYRTARGAKAAVFHPGGRLYVVVGAVNELEAQEQALAKCHSDPTRTEDTAPCFIYAIDNQVVLPQRLEDARPANRFEASNMSFFVTSTSIGRGGDLGGLAGADAHCQRLAAAVGAGGKTWRAYLSTDANAPGGSVNARDRIGKGPWLNAKGTIVARDVEDLHSENNKISLSTALTEQGNMVSGAGTAPYNQHDILTGSTLDGRLVGGSMTCNNWTSSGPGNAMVGHHDRAPQIPANLISWNSAHKSRGCSQQDLNATGGNGLLYCFAAE